MMKHRHHKIGRVLDSVCHKSGMWQETVEQAIQECPRIHYPATKLPKPTRLQPTPHRPWRCGRRQLNRQFRIVLESTILQPGYQNLPDYDPHRPWHCGSCGRPNLTFQRFHNCGNSPKLSVQLLAQQHPQILLCRIFHSTLPRFGVFSEIVLYCSTT